jgi:hypothetical protein
LFPIVAYSPKIYLNITVPESGFCTNWTERLVDTHWKANSGKNEGGIPQLRIPVEMGVDCVREVTE